MTVASTDTGADAARSLTDRIAALDAGRIAADLETTGAALTGPLLSAEECGALVEAYDDPAAYRSHIHMARHGFGRGEYKYFAAPLPPLVRLLRRELYSLLARAANDWAAALRAPQRFPADHEDYLSICHKQGQTKPTPLILRYGEGDYNCLHQDLYGDEVFPLQVAVLLSAPGDDFTGGEFVLSEQRPRMQSRVEVVPLAAGDAVVFAVNERPVQGTRGDYRVKMRHGVSRVRSGERFTLGVIFHDAR